MPMPCSLMIVDAILAIRCGRLLDARPSPDPCFLEVAVRGRSSTDAVFACRMAVEKGLDNKSKCADNLLGSEQKTFRKETARDRLITRGSERKC